MAKDQELDRDVRKVAVRVQQLTNRRFAGKVTLHFDPTGHVRKIETNEIESVDVLSIAS